MARVLGQARNGESNAQALQRIRKEYNLPKRRLNITRDGEIVLAPTYTYSTQPQVQAGEVETGYRIDKGVEEFEIRKQQDIQRQQQSQERQQATPSQIRYASARFQGAEPIATLTSGETLYRIQTPQGAVNYVGREKEVGTNIKSTSFTQYIRGQPATRLETKKQQAVALSRLIAQAQEQKVREYAQDVSQNIQPYQETRDFGSRGQVTITQYRSLKPNRIDLNLIASLKNVPSAYLPIQSAIVQQDPAVKPFIQTSLVASSFAFAGGDVLTRNIPYVNIAYDKFSQVAQPFVEQAIKDPVLTYATVATPLLAGARVYKYLDRADVLQSVVSGIMSGYATKGVGGAIAGGVGSYVGEGISDKAAFFTAGRPSAPTFSYKYIGKYQDFVARPIKSNVEPQFIVDITSKNKLSVTQMSPYTQDFNVLLQYQPKVSRRQEIITRKEFIDVTKTKRLKPSDYARFLRSEKQITLGYKPGKGNLGLYSYSPDKTVTPRIDVSPTLSLSEAEVVISHELIHHKTPRVILGIRGIPFTSQSIPYRLQPSEILAFGLQKPLSKIGFKATITEQRSFDVKYLQRYKILTRAPETEDADFMYRTTEPVLPQVVFTSTKRLTPYVDNTPREIKMQWGKKASVQFFTASSSRSKIIASQFSQTLYEEPSIRVPQTPLQQVMGGSLSQSFTKTPSLKLMSISSQRKLFYTPQTMRLRAKQRVEPATLTRTPSAINQLFAPATMTAMKPATLTRTPSLTRTRTMSQTITRTPTITPTLSPTITRTPTITPTITPTVTITPTLKPKDLNKLFGIVTTRKSKKMSKRYTQSIGALFLRAPKGFSRANISARSGLGIRF